MCTRRLGAAFLCLTLTIGISNAAVVIRHQGANDPISENWVPRGYFTNIATGPIYDDLGTGLNAWMIQDNLGTDEYARHGDWTADVETSAWNYGWTLRFNLRVVADDSVTDFSPFNGIGFDTATYNARYLMRLGLDGQGNTLVNYTDGAGYTSTITVAGTGYHLFEYVCDPSDKTVDCFVDGVQVASNLAPKPNLIGHAEYQGPTFGSRQTDATSTIHYNLVELDIPYIPGDADRDWKVDSLDAAIVASNWLSSDGVTWDSGDFNEDGIVNDVDATLLAVNWGYGTAAAVPEPGIMILLIGALSMICLYRYR